MEATLAVLNALVEDGVIEQYAIGGAVAAIFWVEPFDTIDLDVFVLLPATAHPLDPLRDVIEALSTRSYYDRVYRLLQETAVDRAVVDALIERYGLQTAWDTFLRRYPEASG